MFKVYFLPQQGAFSCQCFGFSVLSSVFSFVCNEQTKEKRLKNQFEEMKGNYVFSYVLPLPPSYSLAFFPSNELFVWIFVSSDLWSLGLASPVVSPVLTTGPGYCHQTCDPPVITYNVLRLKACIRRCYHAYHLNFLTASIMMTPFPYFQSFLLLNPSNNSSLRTISLQALLQRGGKYSMTSPLFQYHCDHWQRKHFPIQCGCWKTLQ